MLDVVNRGCLGIFVCVAVCGGPWVRSVKAWFCNNFIPKQNRDLFETKPFGFREVCPDYNSRTKVQRDEKLNRSKQVSRKPLYVSR
jgi:hypothetical protein